MLYIIISVSNHHWQSMQTKNWAPNNKIGPFPLKKFKKSAVITLNLTFYKNINI